MTWLSKKADEELDDEIRFHLEMETEKNRRAGMSEIDARLEAKRVFGGVHRVREEVRDQRRIRPIEMLLRDIAYAWRTIRHSPAYALTTIITLGAAIGVGAAMMTFVEAAIFAPLPYHDAEKVVTLWETNLAQGEDRLQVSPGNFLDWQERSKSFAAMGLVSDRGVDVPRGDRVVSVSAGLVSIDFFEALGVTPILGRTFEAVDYDRGAEPRVMLSESFWRESYNGEPTLLGRTIEIDGRPAVLLGIVPDGLDAASTYEVYTPLFIHPGERTSRTGHWMNAVARLRDGVSIEEASRDLDRVARILAQEHPATNEPLRVRVIPLREALLGNTERLLIAVSGASACLLLLACANIASLALARGAARRRELTIRAALGAHNSRLVTHLVTESVLLHTIAAIGAFLVASVIILWIASSSPEGLCRMDEVRPGAVTAGIVVVLTALATVLAGVLPALRLVRSGLASDLESSRRSSGLTSGEARLQAVLVVAQISIALLLLTGAGLLTRSLQKLTQNELGFDPRGVSTIQMYLYDVHPDPAERNAFVASSLDAIRALPGVSAVGATTGMPFGPAAAARDDMEIVGQPRRPGENITIRTTGVTPGYFETMRIPIVRGRDFNGFDGPSSRRVAIINETAARRFWNGASPLDSMVRFGLMGPPAEWTIIGVVSDIRELAYSEEPAPQVYVPVAQGGRSAGGLNYVARSSAPQAVLDGMQATIWDLTPSQSIVSADLLERVVRGSLHAQTFALQLIAGFGVTALLLSSIGLFGLLTYVAERRRTEVGIRMALGATSSKIERQFVRRGLSLAAIGISAGIVLSFVFTRVLQSLLYETSPFDFVAVASVVGVTSIVTLLASWIPARRIASLQPSTVLRLE